MAKVLGVAPQKTYEGFPALSVVVARGSEIRRAVDVILRDVVKLHSAVYQLDVLLDVEVSALRDELLSLADIGASIYAVYVGGELKAFGVVVPGPHLPESDCRAEVLGLGPEAKTVVDEALKQCSSPYIVVPSALAGVLDRYLCSRGFALRNRFYRMSMMLDEFDIGVALELRSRLEGLGYTFTDVGSVHPEDLLKLVSETLRDEPTGVQRPEEEAARLLSSEWTLRNASVVALYAGKPVAATFVQGFASKVAYFAYTCVDRDHRRRGLAKAVKALALAELKRLGYVKVSSNNNAANEPMVRVNRALGFKVVREQLGYAKSSSSA